VPDPTNRGRRTLLFVVTEDWYFVSHRLPIAVAARDAGYRVVIAARFAEDQARLAALGFTLRPIRLRRRGASLVGEVRAIRELRRLYQDVSPAIVHHVALKPVIFGSAAAIGLREIAVVNALAGLGLMFASKGTFARAVRPAVAAVLRFLLRRPRSLVIVQSESDRDYLVNRGLAPVSRLRLVSGSGVELDRFTAAVEAPGTPIVAFPGRMLWMKGVGEFVAAARILKAERIDARFVLVGEPDPESRDAVPRETLNGWAREGVVELWGKRSDMPRVLSAVHIVCLPSVYGEGIPKVLLEAAACARPVVTTDWPGCRDAVRPGETGLLVAPGDVNDLARALASLLRDGALRRKLGHAARSLAEREFDVRSVIAATLEAYTELTMERDELSHSAK
jgi:glycosyltransferase involved in cell wall biosynthesis